MPDLVRSEGEKDPENVSDVISEFSGELGGGGPHVALRECWYHLRANRKAKSSDLRRVAAETSNRVDRRWWSETGNAYFRLMPNVVPPSPETGGSWVFDEDGEEAPPVHKNPVAAPDGQIKRALDRLQTHRPVRRNLSPLKRMHEYLVSAGAASTDELKDIYPEADRNQHQYGKYTDTADWFREVGRPVLSGLEDIARPRVAGQDWRFIGIETDEDVPPEELDNRNREAAAEQVENVDVGARGDFAARRRETVLDLYDHLRDQGETTESDLEDRIDHHSLAYSSSGEFFEDIAASALADLPGVEQPADKSVTWEYDVRA